MTQLTTPDIKNMLDQLSQNEVTTDKTEQNTEQKENIDKEKENLEEVAPSTLKVSEDIHGGDESTKDIQESPNAAKEGIETKNQRTSDTPNNHKNNSNPNNNNGNGDDSQNSQGESSNNSNSNEDILEMLAKDEETTISSNTTLSTSTDIFSPKEESYRTSLQDIEELYKDELQQISHSLSFIQLKKKILYLIDILAEELSTKSLTHGDDMLDIEEYIQQRYTKGYCNLYNIMYTQQKEALVIGLDFSGSCESLALEFVQIAKAAEKIQNVELFDASNGFAVGTKATNYKITEPYNAPGYPLSYFYGRTICYFGDFHGTYSMLYLQQYSQIWWFNYTKQMSYQEFKAAITDDLKKYDVAAYKKLLTHYNIRKLYQHTMFCENINDIFKHIKKLTKKI